MNDSVKKSVLFLCTHNSARSQMGEGLLRSMYGNRYEVYSAGVAPGKLNSYVVRSMAEAGIDISAHYAKSVEEFVDREIDVVVTVCDGAKEVCPYFAGAKKMLHQSFTDPSQFKGTDEEILTQTAVVREEIRRWIEKVFA